MNDIVKNINPVVVDPQPQKEYFYIPFKAKQSYTTEMKVTEENDVKKTKVDLINIIFQEVTNICPLLENMSYENIDHFGIENARYAYHIIKDMRMPTLPYLLAQDEILTSLVGKFGPKVYLPKQSTHISSSDTFSSEYDDFLVVDEFMFNFFEYVDTGAKFSVSGLNDQQFKLVRKEVLAINPAEFNTTKVDIASKFRADHMLRAFRKSDNFSELSTQLEKLF